MKETELTVQVLDTFENIKSKLQTQGFVLSENVLMQDCYFSKHTKEDLKKLSYEEMMKNSFLLRQLSNSQSIKLIYKNKSYDNNKNVIAEEKIFTNIDDLQKAKTIFCNAGLNLWCEMQQNMFVFKKENFELVIQIIQDLGIFIEYEETEDLKDLEIEEKVKIMKTHLQNLNLNLDDNFFCKKAYMKFLNEQ